MPGTVCVACKKPGGILMRVFEFRDKDEPLMGGGYKTVKEAVQKGGAVFVHGPTVPFGKFPEVPVVGGYALTPNIDAEFAVEYMRQNAESDLVRNRIIYAVDKPETATRLAKEQESIRSGLEPLDPNRLPRGIETAKVA